MSTYSAVTDLLVGDLTIGNSVDKDRYVQDATDEIDSRIGFMYVLPIAGAASHIVLMLKRCANLIGTGRLVLALGAAGEDSSVHAYGESLLREGQMLLSSIECGQLALGTPKVTVQSEGNAPSTTNYDSSSAVDAFYTFVSPGTYPVLAPVYPLIAPIWKPGS